MDNLQLNGNGRGNGRYSAKAMAKPINFLCIAPDAQEVSVIGDFNEWNGESHAMNRRLVEHADRPAPRASPLPISHRRQAFARSQRQRRCAQRAKRARVAYRRQLTPYFKQ